MSRTLVWTKSGRGEFEDCRGEIKKSQLSKDWDRTALEGEFQKRFLGRLVCHCLGYCTPVTYLLIIR